MSSDASNGVERKIGERLSGFVEALKGESELAYKLAAVEAKCAELTKARDELLQALLEIEVILIVQQDSMHGQDFDAMQECRDKIQKAISQQGVE